MKKKTHKDKGDEIELKRKRDNWRQNWTLRREGSSFLGIIQQQAKNTKNLELLNLFKVSLPGASFDAQVL